MKTLITICCLGLLSTASFAQDRSLAECRNISDVNTRVSCYDAIVDAQQEPQNTPVISSVPAAVPQVSSRTAPPAAAAASRSIADNETQVNLFGAEAELSRAVIAEELGVTQLDQIEAAVEAVSNTAYKQLILRLDNGHTWEQTDSKRLRVREGDQIIVRSGRLGAYFLEKADGSRAIRVKRIL